MNKEDIQLACSVEIDSLSMISQEKKQELGLIELKLLLPIVHKYISLAYDYGSLNNRQRITLNDMNFNG